MNDSNKSTNTLSNGLHASTYQQGGLQILGYGSYLSSCDYSSDCTSSLMCCSNLNSYQYDKCTTDYNCYSNSAYTYNTGQTTTATTLESIFGTICLAACIIGCCVMQRRRRYLAANSNVTVVQTHNVV